MLSSTLPFPASPVSLFCWSSRVDSWKCGSDNIFSLAKPIEETSFFHISLNIPVIVHCLRSCTYRAALWWLKRFQWFDLWQGLTNSCYVSTEKAANGDGNFQSQLSVKVCGVMLELFLIILIFKRQKAGGKKIVSFIRHADIARKKGMSCQADEFLYALW